MRIRQRILDYFRSKPPFKITADMLFYLLLLSLILPFSRKYVATGLNKIVMHRPSVYPENRQEILAPADYDWIMVDLDGREVSFSRFRGEAVFLNFWATWCPPCRAEMPNIQRLYERYGEQLNFVLASNESKDVLSDYLTENGFRMPVYRMVQNPPEILQASSLPTTLVITPEGRIAVRKTGAARWDGKFFVEFLAEMLRE